ncbi:MAG: Gfo/Idh/MocA family oxidoreductase [Caloramator sp.]|nr:Gfo/Idh/MocA family oxidoreductase [Caloramator sp.]
MLKVGLIGIGFMGRGHLDNYIRLESEGYPVKLVAICDIDKEKFEGKFVKGNIDVGNNKYDFSKYNLYTDIDEMLDKEELDYVDIALPTYLHAEVSIKALNKKLHVLCEKPMALTSDECLKMIEAAEKNNRKLMIGHCLRFWPHYECLKEYVDNKKLGNVLSAYFYRGGGTPLWSYQNWLLNKEKSGGAMLDQHIHDVDTINWIFGIPKAVSTIGKVIFENSGYDALSTNYIYDSGVVINSQDDWALNGDYGFKMLYRVNFEKGNMIYEGGKLIINPNDSKSYIPELPNENGYYREIKYFIDCIINNLPIEKAPPISSYQSVCIVESEKASADENGALKNVIIK